MLYEKLCRWLAFCSFFIEVSSHDPGFVLVLDKIGQDRATVKDEMLATRWVFNLDLYLEASVSSKLTQKTMHFTLSEPPDLLPRTFFL